MFLPLAIGKAYEWSIHPVFWIAIHVKSTRKRIFVIKGNDHGVIVDGGISQFPNHDLANSELERKGA